MDYNNLTPDQLMQLEQDKVNAEYKLSNERRLKFIQDQTLKEVMKEFDGCSTEVGRQKRVRNSLVPMFSWE